ncbi:MAG TPA: aminoacyl-tRNA hydrolase [Sedimentisphaerales bacterium]|nr:aminoacyl-tRNA hydrolase [Sedimentisphaerales bacterium]
MGEVKMVVGLGNPGKEYDNTRHNVGFEVVDKLSQKLGIEVTQNKFGGVLGQGVFADKKLILLKPGLYMNRSGQVVATAAGFYKLDLDDVLVVSDDMAIDCGRIRIRTKGSAGGQKGLADVINKLGSDEVTRVRVGIGASEFADSAAYVLGRINNQQRPLIDEAIERACKAVLCWVEHGGAKAMNEYNPDVSGQ